MIKVNPQTHAADLAKTLGPVSAYDLAERMAKAVGPEQRPLLPVGDVFYHTRDDGKPTTLKTKELDQVGSFWTAVAGTLRKRYSLGT